MTALDSTAPSILQTPNGISAATISTPATAATPHYVKRSTIIHSCPPFHPPEQRPHSACMHKSESGGTSTASHITTTSASSRPSSPQYSDSSCPTSLSSSLHSASTSPPAHTPITSKDASINFPPPIASVLSPVSSLKAPSKPPKARPQLPPQPIIKQNHVHQILLPSAHPTLNLPSPQIHLEQAMKAEVVDGSGKPVKFEDLIDRDFKTLVIFIRHFRSGYSQRYIQRLSKIANGEVSVGQKIPKKYDNQSIQSRRTTSNVSVATGVQSNKSDEEYPQDNWISANGVNVIIIGNGNYQLIESYRSILNCPFPIYTDLSKDQRVYKLLGMKKIKDVKLHQSTNNHNNLDYQQHLFHVQSLGHSINTPSGTSPADMKNHSEPLVRNEESKVAFISKVLYNAWKMPWKWSGDPQQLGGELVFEPIREEKLIKRKPIKYKLANGILEKSSSTRSDSSSTCTSAESSSDHDPPASRIHNQPFRRPSCAIKNNKNGILSRSKNPRSVKDTVKEIQVQCKFIHQMTNYQDHFSIDQLMMMSGIRLTSLIQKC
ncbi:hypothetical protein PGT21_023995 [Puccinia graminis f. sp. tritici]|uniref:Uncharacterized protein n=2 Tax=Puccinia graminis f. sp. tritici TaxID=56615 RepID=A0A5B0Q6E1_PUCGR|nr:hypothetical protein PGT21_023995 [Puccinia graminis f. sp. tritici]KAA1122264.1 hypothetical protein PGTUg99_035845 [Puccinia graminis f. sp. tritici]